MLSAVDIVESSLTRRSFLRWAATGSGLLLSGCGPLLREKSGKAPASPGNKYLSGNYAPVMDERPSTPCVVTGKIPDSLRGTFFRTGPNPVFPPNPYHWFDGDGMVHAVRLEGGKAWYMNRFIETEGYLKEKAAGRCLYGGLLAGPPIKNPANTSVVWHHRRLLAAWEGGSPYEISPEDLRTLGRYDFDGRWTSPFTAHPKLDTATGELLIFGYDEKLVRYGVLDPDGKLSRTATIEIPHPVMMHDFAVTANYALLLDLPLVFTERGLQFHPEYGARIGVLPRNGDAAGLRWFRIEPCWVYHVLNAYEDGSTIVLRASRRLDWPKSRASLFEWRLDLSTGMTTERALDSVLSEFPIVNPAVVGRAHRFGYLAREAKDESDAVIKYDLISGTNRVYRFGEGKTGGETLFVSCPGGKAEDSGWLMNFIYDAKSGASELMIIDAQELAPVASVKIPRRVPYGLHANWIAG